MSAGMAPALPQPLKKISGKDKEWIHVRYIPCKRTSLFWPLLSLFPSVLVRLCVPQAPGLFSHQDRDSEKERPKQSCSIIVTYSPPPPREHSAGARAVQFV